MKRIFILKGHPCSGKSTFIKKLGVEAYTLSLDTIREQCFDLNYSMETGFCNEFQQNKNIVFDIYSKMLEARLDHGALTFIDNTNIFGKDLLNCARKARDKGYRVYLVDFSNITLEETLRRNESRDYKKFDKETLVDLYVLAHEPMNIPNWIIQLKPEEVEKELDYLPIDVNHYEKIVHIGDIHGCYDPLEKYFKDGINPNYLYIFHGDYLDRGIQNKEVLLFLLENMEKENFIFLEGNHEYHLKQWANSKPFHKNFIATAKELQGISSKQTRIFLRRLRTLFIYQYHGRNVICSHGGIDKVHSKLMLFNEQTFIRGVGDYDTPIDKIFNDSTSGSNWYQVHGHRNKRLACEIDSFEHSFNLENSVEKGKFLRIVEHSKDGFTPIYIKNDVFKLTDEDLMIQSPADMLKVLRSDEDIKEKKMGDISSFNFSKDVFFNQRWTAKNCKARGIFFNTTTEKIVARGYEKFFNYQELTETTPNELKKHFPYDAYLKYNGFFGLIGYDESTDSIILTSKSVIDGEYVDMFKEILQEKKINLDKIKTVLKERSVNFVFEVIHEKDPHILDFKGNDIILLDAIKRSAKFEKLSYEKLLTIGDELGLNVKEKIATFDTIEDFMKWQEVVSDKNYKLNGEYIEGFVLESTTDGHMFKVKSGYYNYWKALRSYVENTKKLDRAKLLIEANAFTLSNNNISVINKNHIEAEAFIRWLVSQDTEEMNIVSLRKSYFR